MDSLKNAIKEFWPEGGAVSVSPLGSGHINDTYLVTVSGVSGCDKKLALQRINRSVFKDPEGLMENLTGITSFLRSRIEKAGGDPQRETLTFLPARDGRYFYADPSGEYWRCSLFIEDALSLDRAESPEVFKESGAAFGRFQRLLSDYPVETLSETIVGFHDTTARLEIFKRALGEDPVGRASSVMNEAEFFLSRESLARAFSGFPGCGVKLRVTHNDAKLNNVLIDKKSGRGLCVIDLDTVMPGLAMNDFGDAIRFGANTAAEDETDLSKVSLDQVLFKAFAEGFAEGCGDILSEQELRLLPMGAMVMTYENGMRFLTDYLQGDVYFRIHRPGHNLDRARCQIALLKDMEKKRPGMDAVIEELISGRH